MAASLKQKKNSTKRKLAKVNLVLLLASVNSIQKPLPIPKIQDKKTLSNFHFFFLASQA